MHYSTTVITLSLVPALAPPMSTREPVGNKFRDRQVRDYTYQIELANAVIDKTSAPA